MKTSKANSNGSLVRDQVAKVVSDARTGVMYGARCQLRLKAGKIVRVWSIFPVVERKAKKAKVAA